MAGSTIARLGGIAAECWGLFTTAQAAAVGVSRKTLSGLVASGALSRVAQGVYRLSGAPETPHEATYAAWLALGGAALPASPTGAPPVVAAGETAALAHGIGDWFPGERSFIVPARRTTRLLGVRLRVRALEPVDVAFVDGLPVLTVERTIADLMEQWVDRSLIADAIADAARAGTLVSPARLTGYLEPLARVQGMASGAELAAELFEIAGVELEVPRG